MSVPWKQEINFASALLLHSCVTVFLKELSNSLTILYRLSLRTRDKNGIVSSIVLDGYTSVFSRDQDGELAELYFTNTGLALLIVSLSSSVAMNLLLPQLALNLLVAIIFGLTFIASALVACRRKSVIMPVMALRRAGRFIWSDTPFVNFFSLIYIAVALKGLSQLSLRDYVTFRCIAILELVFMKARLAAADVQTQQRMFQRLLESEYIMVDSKLAPVIPSASQPLQQKHIISFTSFQRLFVMFYKTAISHASGSLCGPLGPVTITVPQTEGFFVDEAEQYGWRIYRVSPTLLVLEDCVQEMVTRLRERAPTKERRGVVFLYKKFIAWSHGVLLRRLGRRRVVWLMRVEEKGHGGVYWRGNVNMVSGLKETWLGDAGRFQRIAGTNARTDREAVL